MNTPLSADAALLELAQAAGLDPQWTDVFGKRHELRHEVLRRLLNALERRPDQRKPAQAEGGVGASRDAHGHCPI
jgi:hypothetical protein